jgi:tetratricopeptide (TPR) repeat protein
VLDLLTQLVDRSLVVADARSARVARYRLLETLREYGRERLDESGEAEPFRRRHAAFFVDLAEEAEPELTGAKQTEWLERLEAEHDNLRAAVRSAIAAGDAPTGWRLGGALYRFWSRHSYFSEGRERLDELLRMPASAAAGAPGKAARAKALHGNATLAVQQGQYDVARSLYGQSLELKRELGDRSAIAATLNNLGVVARYQGDVDAALALGGEALALYRDLGDRWAIAASLNNVGFANALRDPTAARGSFEESLALRRELGDKWGVANALENLGHIALQEGAHDQARSHYTEALELARELGEKRVIASLLEDFGALAAAHGQGRRGIVLAGAAAALREALGAPLPPSERTRLEKHLGPARESVTDAAAAEREGRGMALEEAVAMALLAPDPPYSFFHPTASRTGPSSVG